jgi:hypothetical protein
MASLQLLQVTMLSFPRSCRHPPEIERLGDSGADVFTIMKLMGHSTVFERYPHPEPESEELAVNWMALNMPGWRNRQTQRT